MTPTCPRCKTDEHLSYQDFSPARQERYEVTRSSGRPPVTKVRLISPSVSYTCDRCGHVNGHAVPDDWRPAAWAARSAE